ncbi:sensor histidine kinase [Herminiimonas sp. NPDC097707]|uniref:sensor histidine kinase n=1 Tax=Herminiimonas sp. NPDC097707 TaxID=3364007 RepID=UPI00383A471D
MKLPTFKPWGSTAFRMAFNYSALLVLSMLVLLAVFYMQTVNVLQSRIDRQIFTNAHRLENDFVAHGAASLELQIKDILRDGVYSDTEIYLLLNPYGEKVIGNIPAVPFGVKDKVGMVEARVIRNGRETIGRMHIQHLSDNSILVVGSDINHQLEIERLFDRASLIAGLIGLLMSVVGALLFRRELRLRISGIQQIVTHIEAGDLSQRIPASQQEDEFSRLNRDINRMLDQQQRLMDGVRHVSNTIAHNLRTPMTRIRLRLMKSEHEGAQAREEALQFALQEIEELGIIFDKLLNLAEVESGTHRQIFSPVSLNDVVADIVEFYEPVAEEKSIHFSAVFDADPVINGDRELLASAIGNLVDNALKYVNDGATVSIRTTLDASGASIIVQDNGTGIPATELSRIGTHFHRLDRSRPGYGLGLASVLAIARLHGGNLEFSDAAPGLIVRMTLAPHPA